MIIRMATDRIIFDYAHDCRPTVFDYAHDCRPDIHQQVTELALREALQQKGEYAVKGTANTGHAPMAGDT